VIENSMLKKRLLFVRTAKVMILGKFKNELYKTK
jgi:hypothetical protein